MGGQPILVDLNDLMQLFQSISAEGGGGGGMPPGEPTETNVEIGKRLDSIESSIADLAEMMQSLVGGAPAPGGAAGAEPPPQELIDAINAGAAPGSEASMGAPLPPEAAAGVAGPGAMPVSASSINGSTKTAALSIGRLAQRLRTKR